MVINALELLLKQQRFDLIFKYIYFSKNNRYTEDSYLENIRAFNDFHELNPSDGVAKNSADDFLNSYKTLYKNIKENGFSSEIGQIPIGSNGEITDGAHRLAISAYLSLDIEVYDDKVNNALYNYKYFISHQMNPDVMDFGALEYVKLNPNAYIVNLHSITDTSKDIEVEEILSKYGFIFYKKNINLNINGYVNLKKLSYGSFWERESWIGTPENKFAGAQNHAKRSMGKSPLRAYVFVCEDFDNILLVKKEIRELFNIGNQSVHINDYREEAIWLAEFYFNKNSLFMMNNRSFIYEDIEFDSSIDSLKSTAKEYNIDIENICASGSTPLNIFGARKSDDLDFICKDKSFDIQTEELSNHESQLKYYPYSKNEIIENPEYHFYYHGLKFITLDVLYKMKICRAEKPKDFNDCKIIRKIFRKNKKAILINHIRNNMLYKKLIKPLYRKLKQLK